MSSTNSKLINIFYTTNNAIWTEDELALYYENILKVNTDNADLMVDLFTLYTRMGECKKMQLLAQKLYKARGEQKYLYWSIGSMLQQSDLSATMLIVAEKMFQKLFYDPATPR